MQVAFTATHKTYPITFTPIQIVNVKNNIIRSTHNSKFTNPIIQTAQSEITNAKGLVCDLLPCLNLHMC